MGSLCAKSEAPCCNAEALERRRVEELSLLFVTLYVDAGTTGGNTGLGRRGGLAVEPQMARCGLDAAVCPNSVSNFLAMMARTPLCNN